MSSLRPATIVETLFNLIGGALSSPTEPDGPGCSCQKCEQAWNRNQMLKRISQRAQLGGGLHRDRPGLRIS
jgi:beta-lactamase class A